MTHDLTTHSFTATTRTFWIAHGPALHFGVLAPGESLSSGQDSFETFPRRLPWRTRVIALGGNPDGATQ
jgi:hypothetical protein